MKNKKFLPVVLVILVLMTATLACEFSATTANISNAHMAVDEADSASTEVYDPAAPAFYCIFDLNNAPDDSVITGVWTLVEAEGYDPDQVIDEVEYIGGDDTLTFSLESGGQEWPVGTYKIDLYLNDELVQTLNFEVK